MNIEEKPKINEPKLYATLGKFLEEGFVCRAA